MNLQAQHIAKAGLFQTSRLLLQKTFTLKIFSACGAPIKMYAYAIKPGEARLQGILR
jgi:hypothetical protein